MQGRRPSALWAVLLEHLITMLEHHFFLHEGDGLDGPRPLQFLVVQTNRLFVSVHLNTYDNACCFQNKLLCLLIAFIS